MPKMQLYHWLRLNAAQRKGLPMVSLRRHTESFGKFHEKFSRLIYINTRCIVVMLESDREEKVLKKLRLTQVQEKPVDEQRNQNKSCQMKNNVHAHHAERPNLYCLSGGDKVDLRRIMKRTPKGAARIAQVNQGVHPDPTAPTIPQPSSTRILVRAVEAPDLVPLSAASASMRPDPNSGVGAPSPLRVM
jgi:hypothetical protein